MDISFIFQTPLVKKIFVSAVSEIITFLLAIFLHIYFIILIFVTDSNYIRILRHRVGSYLKKLKNLNTQINTWNGSRRCYYYSTNCLFLCVISHYLHTKYFMWFHLLKTFMNEVLINCSSTKNNNREILRK